MNAKAAFRMDRRNFLVSTSFAVAGALLSTRELLATSDSVSASGLVQKARERAAIATIKVQSLRGNVSVLTGSEGILQSFRGATASCLSMLATRLPDRKSRMHWPGSAQIRSGISSIRTGTSIIPTATNGCMRKALPSWHTRTHENIFPPQPKSRDGTIRSRPLPPGNSGGRIFRCADAAHERRDDCAEVLSAGAHRW